MKTQTLLLINTGDHAGLHLANLDKLGDGANTATRQLRGGDETLDAVVLEQSHVHSTVGDSKEDERRKNGTHFITFTITTSSTFGNSFA